MAFKVFVSNDVSEKGVALLREHFDVDVMPNMPVPELCKIIGEYDALVSRSQIQVTKELIDAATNLKVIGRAGVGVDNIDIPAATARGIVVLNTPEGNTMAATEHTVAMLMAMTRHIPQAHQSMQEGRWDRKSFDGIQVQNRTLGIIGVGRIGSRVAKRMQGMEMTTIGYDPYITEERARQVGVELVDLDTLLAKSDYITIHTPLTKETEKMIANGVNKIDINLDGPASDPTSNVDAVLNKIKIKVKGKLLDTKSSYTIELSHDELKGFLFSWGYISDNLMNYFYDNIPFTVKAKVEGENIKDMELKIKNNVILKEKED